MLALSVRLYGLNWDQGQHLHPDERMIVMVTEKISIPTTNLFSVDSTLNPHFFAYGSLPIYLLKFTSSLLVPIFPQIGSYEQINLLGRVISAIFDSLTVLLIFHICQRMFENTRQSLLAALVYTVSILPIQLSHFYAVDTILTFFIFFTLLQLIAYFQNQKIFNLLLASIGIGLSLATKISATVLVASLGTSLVAGILLTIRNQIFSHNQPLHQKISSFIGHIFSLKKLRHSRLSIIIKVFCLLIFTSTIAAVVFIVCEPFALIDYPNFIRQIMEQQAMTKNAFVFPYTLQYVNTTPYLYQLENIFLWGLGPIIGTLSFIGFIIVNIKLVKGLIVPGNDQSEGAQLIILTFFLAYFFVVGGFAIKFMRYCLPLYPIFIIYAAHLLTSIKSKFVVLFIFLGHLCLLFAFLAIYRLPNTRVTATNWINSQVPQGSTILIEHWDDALPLGYLNNLNQISLPLYDSDSDPHKWNFINQMLVRGDYIIIASNRLSTPLPKLVNCDQLPEDKCYPLTARYYRDLFAGNLGYTKVAEFTSYPTLFGFSVNDQSADESFTVYDHPQIMIFKKTF
ncbi:MAG: glycosyltransferase family 39 protein [Microgenomates group bacterium]